MIDVSFCKLGVAIALAGGAIAASASVLTFDDLVGGAQVFSSAYAGFIFDQSWFWSDDNTVCDAGGTCTPYTWYKSAFTSVSTLVVDAPDPTESGPISASAPFVFNGAWFTSGADGIEIDFNLYLGGALVHSTPGASLNFGDPSTYFASNYSGLVDQVRVVAYQGFYALDNFEFERVGAPVPEPASAVLALAAIGALALGRRRGAALAGEWT